MMRLECAASRRLLGSESPLPPSAGTCRAAAGEDENRAATADRPGPARWVVAGSAARSSARRRRRRLLMAGVACACGEAQPS